MLLFMPYIKICVGMVGQMGDGKEQMQKKDQTI